MRHWRRWMREWIKKMRHWRRWTREWIKWMRHWIKWTHVWRRWTCLWIKPTHHWTQKMRIPTETRPYCTRYALLLKARHAPWAAATCRRRPPRDLSRKSRGTATTYGVETDCVTFWAQKSRRLPGGFL